MILTEEADFTSKRFSHVSALALDFLQKVSFPSLSVSDSVLVAPGERSKPTLDSSGSFGSSFHPTGSPFLSSFPHSDLFTSLSLIR
jgi:hypothetical protein